MMQVVGNSTFIRRRAVKRTRTVAAAASGSKRRKVASASRKCPRLLLDLPTALIAHVMTFCELRPLARLARVNKHLLHAVNAAPPSAMQHIQFRPLTEANLNYLGASLPISHVDLSLLTFRQRNPSGETHRSVARCLMQRFRMVELHVSYAWSTSMAMSSSDFNTHPTLRRLHLLHMSGFDDFVPRMLRELTLPLSCLDLSVGTGMFSYADALFDNAILARHVQRLWLGKNISLRQHERLVELARLRELSIVVDKVTNPSIMPAIGRLASLEKLELVGDEFYVKRLLPQAFPSLRSLRHLVIGASVSTELFRGCELPCLRVLRVDRLTLNEPDNEPEQLNLPRGARVITRLPNKPDVLERLRSRLHALGVALLSHHPVCRYDCLDSYRASGCRHDR